MTSVLLKKSLFARNIVSYTIQTIEFPKYFYHTEPNVVRSKVPDINIPNIFLEEYVWKNIHKWHNKTALICAETGRSYLFSEVYSKSRALANFLNKFPNLNQGDTVAIILPNVPEFPIVIFGAIQAGLKVSPFNWLLTSDEIQRQLLKSESKVVFTLTEFWPKVNDAVEKLNLDIRIIVIDHQQNQSTPPKAIKFTKTVEGDHELLFKVTKTVDDVLFLPFSSGTTGLPKGVQITNKNLVSNLLQMSVKEFVVPSCTEEQEVTLAVLPFFHIYGLVMVLINLLALGCKLVTIPKFGPTIFLKALEEQRPSFAYLVPPIVLFLINNSEVRPKYISQLRKIVSGAAPLGAADIERLHLKSNGIVEFLQAYGLTEASPLTHSQTTKISSGHKLGGIGYAIPNTECKIVSSDGKSKIGLGPNESGELLIRGPQVMKGYHKNIEATRAAIDSHGWCSTGDIAYYDEDGHFFVTDRLKELIKVKGFQVAPAELEELLRNHPDIEDAAVIGVHHNTFGEVPRAFIVPKKDVSFSASKVQEYMAVKAAKYKQLLGGISVIDVIPKTASGKILRRELKDL